MRFIRKLIGNARGATAIEYALVASLIAIAGIVAMRGLGSNIENTFDNVASAVSP